MKLDPNKANITVLFNTLLSPDCDNAGILKQEGQNNILPYWSVYNKNIKAGGVTSSNEWHSITLVCLVWVYWIATNLINVINEHKI